MTTLQERRQQFPLFVLIISLFFIAGTTAIPANCITFTLGSHLQFQCTGIPALTFRDQINSPHNGLIPYLSYPFEYFFIAGVIQLTINLLDKFIVANNDAGIVYISNFIMALFAIASVLLLQRMKVKFTRIAFFILTPVAFIFSLSFDYAQIFLILLSIYFLRKQQTYSSAITYGLACLIKGYPLFFAPFIMTELARVNFRNTNKLPTEKLVGKFSWLFVVLCTFSSGLLTQFALSPSNFLHATSYLTTYGIEGSWLGLLFPQDVINYATTSTWIIGSGSQIPIPHIYQLISAALFLASLATIYFYGKRLGVFDKLFLCFSCALIFLWISAPQMFLNLVILIPLTRISLNKRNYIIYTLSSFFSCDLLILGYLLQFHGSNLTSLYLQIMSMAFLILLIAFNYLRSDGTRWQCKAEAVQGNTTYYCLKAKGHTGSHFFTDYDYNTHHDVTHISKEN